MFNLNWKPKTGHRTLDTGTGSRKAQAAMEYLMTYGWAILVIAIAVAILWLYLPKTPETCKFRDTGFSCSEEAGEFGIVSNVSKDSQAYVVVNLKNLKGKTIEVHSVLCTDASLADAPKSKATQIDMNISAGSTRKISAECFDKDGNAIAKQPTESFSGILVLYYNFDPDVIPVDRTAEASISGTVLEG